MRGVRTYIKVARHADRPGRVPLHHVLVAPPMVRPLVLLPSRASARLHGADPLRAASDKCQALRDETIVSVAGWLGLATRIMSVSLDLPRVIVQRSAVFCITHPG